MSIKNYFSFLLKIVLKVVQNLNESKVLIFFFINHHYYHRYFYQKYFYNFFFLMSKRFSVLKFLE